MSVLLLVRHGQASFGFGDYDRLSEQGRQQARVTGDALAARGVRIDRVACGTLARQRETAELLAGAAQAPPPQVAPEWDEYDHEPVLVRGEPRWRRRWVMTADLARRPERGRHLQAVLERGLTAWIADGGTAGPGGGETFAAYQQRAERGLAAAAELPGTTVVVSSAGTIAAAIAPLLGVPAERWPALQRVMVNASITKVVAGRSGVSLVSFNEHGHLEHAAGVKITYR